MPPVSPLRAPLRDPRIYGNKGMEKEEMLRVVSAGRLTPRLFLCCDVNDSYPVDSVFSLYDEGQRLSTLDVCAMEDDEFSNPMAAGVIRDMALNTDIGQSSVALRVSPAPGRVMRGASSTLRSDIKTKVKPSIFDVVSPQQMGASGSKSSELEAKDAAVSSLLAWVDDARREKMMGGYSEMPVELRQRLLRDAVAKMGSVGAISQCAPRNLMQF